jgi:hypothetical protein
MSYLGPIIKTEFLLLRGLTIQLRTIEICFARGPFYAPGTKNDPVNLVHRYTSTTPTLLQVHHESRIEGLKYYQLSNSSPNAMNQFYFNPAVGILDTTAGWSQWHVFLKNNECGLLTQV